MQKFLVHSSIQRQCARIRRASWWACLRIWHNRTWDGGSPGCGTGILILLSRHWGIYDYVDSHRTMIGRHLQRQLQRLWQRQLWEGYGLETNRLRNKINCLLSLRLVWLENCISCCGWHYGYTYTIKCSGCDPLLEPSCNMSLDLR